MKKIREGTGGMCALLSGVVFPAMPEAATDEENWPAALRVVGLRWGSLVAGDGPAIGPGKEKALVWSLLTVIDIIGTTRVVIRNP